MQEKQPSASLQPLPSARAGLQRAGDSEEQSMARNDDGAQALLWRPRNAQGGAWPMVIHG